MSASVDRIEWLARILLWADIRHDTQSLSESVIWMRHRDAYRALAKGCLYEADLRGDLVIPSAIFRQKVDAGTQAFLAAHDDAYAAAIRKASNGGDALGLTADDTMAAYAAARRAGVKAAIAAAGYNDLGALAVRYGHLVQDVGECTCGGGGPIGHERECGYEVVCSLSDLDGFDAEVAYRLSEQNRDHTQVVFERDETIRAKDEIIAALTAERDVLRTAVGATSDGSGT